MSSQQHNDTVLLHPSSQSDIDEIKNLINGSVQSGPSRVLPARPPSPPRAFIPVSSSPFPVSSSLFISSNLPPPSNYKNQKPPAPHVSVPVPHAAALPSLPNSSNRGGNNNAAGMAGFGSPPNTLTEPVWDTVKRDLSRIVSSLKLLVFPNPFREDPGKALRD